MPREQRRVEESHRSPAAFKSGVAAFLFASLLAALGWGVVVQAVRETPFEEASLGGLHLKLESARWVLDQMDHGENFTKPSVMMPDMPDWGKQRLTIDVSFENRSGLPQVYDGLEFFLVPELGEDLSPVGAQVGKAELLPGHAFNTAVHFDLDTVEPHGRLRVEWRRHGDTAYLPIPEPAEHYHLRPRGGDIALPDDARLLLPLGTPERGERLFAGMCLACHGDPRLPGTHTVGPHLAQIGTRAGTRVEGLTAAQYIYQSILEPGAFIAPECNDGPCSEPTAMPEYAALLSLQDFADLLTYLVEL